MKLLILFILSLSYVVQIGYTDDWTVLRTKGDVLTLLKKEWLSVRKGQALRDSSNLNIGKESMIRLLSPQGKLVTIKGAKNVALTDYAKRKETVVKTTGVLEELFSQRSIIRMNAVRSAKGQDTFEAEWLDFCKVESLRKKKFEDYLHLAAACQNKKFLNRCYYVLAKMLNAFPQSGGVKAIYKSIDQEFKLNSVWKVQGVKNGKKELLTNNVILKHKDSVQFSMKSESENYLTFYLTAKGKKGDIESTMIFPEDTPHISKSRLDKGTVYFPSEDSTYMLDNNPGVEYFWGISGAGPVKPSVLKNVKALVEKETDVKEIKLGVNKLIVDRQSKFFIFLINHAE